MRDSELLPVNFTISAAAKFEIENLKNVWNTSSLDPAAVVVIAWGLFRSNSGKRWENVFVTFYGKSQFAEVAHGIQDASGLPVVFFTTPEHHQEFEGKIIDHVEERGFFLREP
jgi:hypothetical protein